MKIFGHPLHLILIHFPSALFPMDVICSIVALRTHEQPFVYASALAMGGGTILGWLAIITGTFDLMAVVKNKPGSVKKALTHGGFNLIVLIGYTLLTMMTLKKYPGIGYDSTAVLTTKIILVLLLLVGNFIGGSLLLKDKVLDEK